MSLPKNTTHLASSLACNIQAFRYKKHVYGVQFHPELTYKDLKYRATLYPKYSENNNDLLDHSRHLAGVEVVFSF